MKSIYRYLFIGAGALLGLVLVAGLALSLIAQSRLNKRYDIPVDTILIVGDEDARKRGEHLVRAVSSCASCHGPDLGGQALIDVPLMGQIYAPNLTAGEGGKAAQYSSEDWLRTLGHGVGPGGRPLLFMPSQYYRRYDYSDLAAIVTYIRSLPPVDQETPPTRLTVIGRVLFALGLLEELPAEIIDHDTPPPQRPEAGISPQYGEFLVTVATCQNCHGENLAGGEVGPDDPFAPNLTPGGELAAWTEEDFITLIRTGVHPSGRSIDPVMPWQAYQNMTDEELRAIWAFLRRLPALPTNAQ